MTDEQNKRYLARRFFKSLKCSVMDFMTHTSVHGAKYVCEDERSLLERILWVVLLSAGLGIGSFMVLNIYYRYTSTPTVSIIEHSHYPTWRLPIPAITLCNNNRVQQTRAETFVQQISIPDHLNRSTVLNDLRVLGDLTFPEFPPDRHLLETVQDLLDFNGISVEQIMLELAQPCHEMLERCSWQNEIVKCSDLFEMRKSHHGYCCSFNYIGVQDSPTRKGWVRKEQSIHTRLYGQRMGLSLLVNPAVDDYFVASYVSEGITVLVHDPQTYPDNSVIMKMIPVKKEVLVPIRLSYRFSSDDVRALAPDIRDCLFSEENHLERFPEYSNVNCITECRMNHSLELCSCIPYYFPNNGNHRVCDLMDSPCFYDNFRTLHSFKPGAERLTNLVVEERNDQLLKAVATEKAMTCNCPSQCNSMSYQARVSWGDFTASEHSVNQLFGPDTNDTHRILLHIFMESNFSQVMKIDIPTSKSILLALLGGVTCIFLGCSFVTLVEILYFLIIRLPGFFSSDGEEGDSCPASPRTVREQRFPSVRTNNARVIEILAYDSSSSLRDKIGT